MKSSKHKWWKNLLIFLLLPLVLFYLPIPVKSAVRDETLNAIVNAGFLSAIESSEHPADLQDFVGQKVTLICDVYSEQVTDPSDYEFTVLAINLDGIPTAVKHPCGIYVYPKEFVGGAIRKSPAYIYDNTFIFRGTLRNATWADGKDNVNAFRLVLSSWDIVYPVHHCYWHLWPDSDYYRGHIFVFDYLLPKFLQPNYL